MYTQHSKKDLDEAYGLPCAKSVKMSLQGDSLFEWVLLGFVQTNSLASAKHGDGLVGYIRIWATPLKELVF